MAVRGADRSVAVGHLQSASVRALAVALAGYWRPDRDFRALLSEGRLCRTFQAVRQPVPVQ